MDRPTAPAPVPPRDWPFGRPPRLSLAEATDAPDAGRLLEEAVWQNFRPRGAALRLSFAPADSGAADAAASLDPAAGMLLEDGFLIEHDRSRTGMKPGSRWSVTIDEGPEDLRGRRLGARLDFCSPQVGIGGTFDDAAAVADAPSFAAEADATQRWIADALGDSEFRWDTRAVTRSMLRYMMGALMQSAMPRAALADTLLLDTDVAPAPRAVAAAMAEFDGLGKALSHDYALSRPTPCHLADPLRLALYPHLLVCIGGFLSNYKRRFVIQNALDIGVEAKLALHRELIYGDTTDEGHRAVWVDWGSHGAGRGMASLSSARWLQNARALEWGEMFDTSFRLWSVMGKPSRPAFEQARDAALLAAEANALRREAHLYLAHVHALRTNPDSPRAKFVADRLATKATWRQAQANDGVSPFPDTDEADRWIEAALALENEAAATEDRLDLMPLDFVTEDFRPSLAGALYLPALALSCLIEQLELR